MELKQLRYFVCLADELHFGRAAQKLHIAQPALSIQIKNLEESLGGQLFIRDKRNVILTDVGENLLVEARRLLNASDNFLQQADQLFHGRTGKINISYSGLSAYIGIVGKVLEQYKKHYPQVDIHIEEHDPVQQIESILNGDMHAGFMTTLGLPVHHTLNTLFLTSSPLCAILPKNHRLANRKYFSYEELKTEPFVIYSVADAPGTSVIEEVFGFSPIVALKTSTPLLLPSLVSAGLGIAVLPVAFEKIALDAGTIVKPLLCPHTMDVSLIWPKNRTAPAMSHFVKTVKTLFVEGAPETV